ncbi:protein nessun dorma [Trichogramma pretiosum]|uniref:protein nessun dorma n=1 Tax=Trichogramma pretiosum TaxID=7493 RepID=UPI0006C94CE6|nr:protein nessun dorma [Trichogramma pretiosum]XP_014225878.1 protein nessun dorma [Trichogramma pretiosum]XP_023315902.1 protein nessun dorma [Trichogramma pretiosum]
MDIFIFEKSLQERQSEYLNILSNTEENEVIPSSKIFGEWMLYIDVVIEPTGWRALWKIPRLTCEEFKIRYPTIVAVTVKHLELSNLTAVVDIVAVQDDIHLPETCDVPLKELYPTKEQGNIVLDIERTAECLDQLRFFYNYLWRPWDIDDDHSIGWCEAHLEDRLRLFYDMKLGNVSGKTCDVVRTLMRESRDIETRIAQLEEEMTDSLSEESEDDSEESKKNEMRTSELLRLNLRLSHIKTEMEVLENPEMRDMFVKNHTFNGNEGEIKRRKSRGQQREAYFIWLGGSLQDTIEAFKSCQDFLPANIFTKTSNNLQEALDVSKTEDIIVIGVGEHNILSAGNLENGGTIRGLGKTESVIVAPKETEVGPCVLDFSGQETVLENLTINLKNLQFGILARKGTLILKNCCLNITNESVTKHGIIVLPGAKLIAKETKFIGLGTGLVVHSEAQATLMNCSFENCYEGIQLNEKSKLSATGCIFTDCKEYAIRQEVDELNNSLIRVGDVDLLSHIPDVSVTNCTFINIAMGNVHLSSCSDRVLPVKPEAMNIQ